MDWLDQLAGYGERAVDAYATVAGAKQNKLPEPAKTATTTTPSWILPAAIGGVLLVVVLVFLGRK